MKNLIKFSFIILLLVFSKPIKAQDNNLYFMVDTISIPKKQRIVEINKTVPSTLYENEYEFFCKCIAPYKKNLVFFYIDTKNNVQENLFHTKPNQKYISWQELIELIEKHQNNFDQRYNLHIVERLPNNRYKTNLVKLERHTVVE